MCAIALITVRLMGNRTVGQLSPFDFIIMVGIGDIIVSASMDKAQNIWFGIEGLVALLVLQQVLSYLALKNNTMRKWVEGTPVTLIKDGKLLKDNFAKTYFNFDDFRQELHRQGMDMTDIKDIKMARLESCGVFSVIKIEDKEPLTRRDFEEFLNSIQDNPLSPWGRQWSKIEQLSQDVQALTALLKEQQLKEQQADSAITKELP
nr:YetF domain-containing protein [Dendrosporobacter quercicolus]